MKITSIYIALVLMLCLDTNVIKSQSNISVQSIRTIHHYATDYSTDTVYLVTQGVGLPYFGHLADTSVYSFSDSVIVHYCYWANGTATTTYQATDTVLLGVYTAGIYQVRLHLSITSLGYDTCNNSNKRDTFDFSFPVYDPNNISTVNSSVTFSLAPNPATTQTTITISASMVGSTLTVTDLTGRKVSNTQLLSQHSTFQTQHLPNGIYLLTVEKDGNRATQKLVVGK